MNVKKGKVVNGTIEGFVGWKVVMGVNGKGVCCEMGRSGHEMWKGPRGVVWFCLVSLFWLEEAAKVLKVETDLKSS